MNSIGVLRPQVRGGDSSGGSSERRPYAHRIPINHPATTFSSNGAESILLLLLLQSKTGSAAQGPGGAALPNSGFQIPGIEIPPPPQEFSLEIGNPKVQEPIKFLMQDAPRAAPEIGHPVIGIG